MAKVFSKQFAVEDFERIESVRPITLMTPESEGWRTATNGFYKVADVEAFIRKFGYADKYDKPDRLNFGGRHVVGAFSAHRTDDENNEHSTSNIEHRTSNGGDASPRALSDRSGFIRFRREECGEGEI